MSSKRKSPPTRISSGQLCGQCPEAQSDQDCDIPELQSNLVMDAGLSSSSADEMLNDDPTRSRTDAKIRSSSPAVTANVRSNIAYDDRNINNNTDSEDYGSEMSYPKSPSWDSMNRTSIGNSANNNNNSNNNNNNSSKKSVHDVVQRLTSKMNNTVSCDQRNSSDEDTSLG